MKIALIHPLKHHAYYTMEGLLKYSEDSQAFFGYYNRGDILDKLLKKTRYRNLLNGYKNEKITEHVNISYTLKFLFLLSRLYPSIFKKFYLRRYENWCIRHLDEFDAIYVLQDYCNKVIKVAAEKEKIIIYDQIIAFNYNKYVGGCSSLESVAVNEQQIKNLMKASKVICPSDFVASTLMMSETGVDITNKIVRINYGGDIKKYSFQKKNVTDKLRLLFVGSDFKRKGLNYLISAMKQLEKEKVSLTIVGAINSHESEEILKKAKQLNNIKYLGTVPNKDMHKIYASHDVFILPSLAEGSSLSIFEALASGLPCIVTERCGSTVENVVSGLIIDSKSSSSIKKAITTLIANKKMISQMSVNARINAEHNTWYKYEEEIASLMFKL